MYRLAAALLVLAPTSSFAYTIAQSSAGAPLHWTAPSVTLTIDPGSPSVLDAGKVSAVLAAAAATWSQLPESRVLMETGASVNQVRFIQHDWPYGAEMLAFTVLQAHPESGVVVSAVIEVNEQDHRFTLDDAPTPDGQPHFDLSAVLTHELGHVLGLGHSTEAEATMFASTAPWDKHQRAPDADDRLGLAFLYDQAPTEPSSPPASAEPSPSPAQTISSAMPPLSTAAGCSAAGGGPTEDWLSLCLMLLLGVTVRWRGRQAPGSQRVTAMTNHPSQVSQVRDFGALR